MDSITAVVLLTLHSVNGSEIYINASEITSMREAREDDRNDKLTALGSRCHVAMTDGKFASVTEECREIREQLQDRLDRAVQRLREMEHDK